MTIIDRDVPHDEAVAALARRLRIQFPELSPTEVESIVRRSVGSGPVEVPEHRPRSAGHGQHLRA